MADYSIVHKPSMIVVGVSCRTSNAPTAGPKDIPRLWERFYSENVSRKIANRVSDDVIALYCEYEGDHTRPYSLVIGYPVGSLESVPNGMVAKFVPEATYAVFRAVGEYPKCVLETWGNIWQSRLNRRFSGDFEVYGSKFATGASKEVEVYVAIKAEQVAKKH